MEISKDCVFYPSNGYIVIEVINIKKESVFTFEEEIDPISKGRLIRCEETSNLNLKVGCVIYYETFLSKEITLLNGDVITIIPTSSLLGFTG